MLSYDDDKTPKLDPAKQKQARSLGLHAIQVVVFENEEQMQPTGVGGVAYYVFSAFVPRVGETFIMEDSKPCVIRRVCYRSERRDGFPFLSVTVMGILKAE